MGAKLRIKTETAKNNDMILAITESCGYNMSHTRTSLITIVTGLAVAEKPWQKR